MTIAPPSPAVQRLFYEASIPALPRGLSATTAALAYALADVDDGPAGDLLRARGVTPEVLERLASTNSANVSGPVPPPLASGSAIERNVLSAATRRGEQVGARVLTPIHLLWALVTADDALGDLLRSRGIVAELVATFHDPEADLLPDFDAISAISTRHDPAFRWIAEVVAMEVELHRDDDRVDTFVGLNVFPRGATFQIRTSYATSPNDRFADPARGMGMWDVDESWGGRTAMCFPRSGQGDETTEWLEYWLPCLPEGSITLTFAHPDGMRHTLDLDGAVLRRAAARSRRRDPGSGGAGAAVPKHPRPLGPSLGSEATPSG